MKKTIETLSFTVGDQTFIGKALADGLTTQILSAVLPLHGEMRRYGDEMYFTVQINQEYDNNNTNSFEIGDLIYWKSKKSTKEAIAIFFGNTPVEDGTRPRAPSDAVVIAKFDVSEVTLENLTTGIHGSIKQIPSP